jgi:hypothetical protein
MTTIAIQIKENMATMPDTLNTKKEVETYFKEALKNIAVVGKTKSVDVDKPKKELNAYQQYVKDNIKQVTEQLKEQSPEKTGKDVLTLIAKMWRESKNGDNVKPTNDEAKQTKEEEKPNDTEIEEEKPPNDKPPDVATVKTKKKK